MAYEIRYSDEAIDALRKLRAFDRAAILDQLAQILSVNPTGVGQSRVKRLRQPAPTEYRLRVGDFRVFYDVGGNIVFVVRIMTKQDSIGYLGGPRANMSVHMTDLKTPIGEVLDTAEAEGVILEPEGRGQYALLRLDDDLLDYLLERNPRFRKECEQIRERMRAGRSHSHDEVKRMLDGQ